MEMEFNDPPTINDGYYKQNLKELELAKKDLAKMRELVLSLLTNK